MMKTSLFVLLVLLSVAQHTIQGCLPQPTCSECLKSPGCAWCRQKDFLKTGESNERRCDTEESLRLRKCDGKHVINPKPDRVDVQNINLRSNTYSDTVVQLKPQNLKFKLRVGVPQTFTVSFKRAEGYPIDLYYLMDLSFSMKDDLEKIKHLGQDILNTLKTFTDKIRIGFGSFVDKVVLPYVSQVKNKRKNPCPNRVDDCQPAFSFQNILKLTERAADFKTKVSSQRISGNLDSPEAGLDAIMQAAVCQEAIGWDNVTRILVYTSDDTFHIAGDGSLAGIYEPHDGKCHLNGSGFYDGTKYDYPSIGHLSRVLSANNIQLIFAVTEDSVPDYEALSRLIPQSVVGVLKDDSSNVVELIAQAYNNLSSTIFLESHGAPHGLDVTYQSHCVLDKSDTSWWKRGECTNVKINQEVKFTARLNISQCLPGPKEFHLKVQGISETLKVTVETLCDCNCDPDVLSSADCSGNGTLRCGICSCDSGFTGQKCECKQHKGAALMDADCRENNSTQLCSGHGNCECGKCVCHSGHSGQFCQCDDTSCKRHNNLLCGGKGNCVCGKCNCHSDYSGEMCECSILTNNCAEKGEKLCGGHGICDCNKCECKDGFTGKFCSEVYNACPRYKMCMTCIEENENGAWNKNCTDKCFPVKPKRVDGVKDFPCSTDVYMYDVKLSTDGTIVIHYTPLPSTIDKTFVIIGSSVSGIIFIGLAVIIVCRLLLELRYRREYSSFLKAQEEQVWKENNSLFLNATTTVMNPMHDDNESLKD